MAILQTLKNMLFPTDPVRNKQNKHKLGSWANWVKQPEESSWVYIQRLPNAVPQHSSSERQLLASSWREADAPRQQKGIRKFGGQNTELGEVRETSLQREKKGQHNPLLKLSTKNWHLPSNTTKVHLVKAMYFPVVMYGCESWTMKIADCWRIDASPMDWSMPGLPVLHHCPALAQTHVHWVSDAILSSCPLSSPSPAFNPFQHQDPL